MEGELEELAPDVSVKQMMDMIGDERFVDDQSGYGQVVRVRDDLPHPDLATLWVAPTGSVTAPFIPWRMGAEDVPPQYGEHRYLTKDSPSTFLDPDYQAQEATGFAGGTFKRFMYHTCGHPEEFLPEVTEALGTFERRALDGQVSVERTAAALYDAGEEELAREYLTEQANDTAMEGLDLGNALLGSIEARAELLYGIEAPEGDEINASGDDETVNCLAGAEPDLPPEDQ